MSNDMTIGATLLIVGAITAGASFTSLSTGCALDDVPSARQDPAGHTRQNTLSLAVAAVLLVCGAVLYLLGI